MPTSLRDGGYLAEVVADSIANGVRLTTIKVRYPHGVHKDMLRHREQSPLYESYRAQPPEHIIAALRDGGAFKPEVFGHRTTGMGQRDESVDGEVAIDQLAMSRAWQDHVDETCEIAEHFLTRNIAKQQTNFLLQDLSFITGLITATSWSNFFALRLELKGDGSPMARPEVYKICLMMSDVLDASTPVDRSDGSWHLPLVDDEEVGRDLTNDPTHRESMYRHWALVSAGRCARVSYARQDEIEDVERSLERAERLLRSGHMSPFEQQARPLTARDLYGVGAEIGVLQERLMIPIGKARRVADYTLDPGDVRCGNFTGWAMHRKFFPAEDDYGALRETLAESTAS